MVVDGVVSRLSPVKYNGPLVKLNKKIRYDADPKMIELFVQICSECAVINNEIDKGGDPVKAIFPKNVQAMFDDYEEEIWDHMQDDRSHLIKFLWGRSQLKAMKYACNIASFYRRFSRENPPVVDEPAARWSIDFDRNMTQWMVKQVVNEGLGFKLTDPNNRLQMDHVKKIISQFMKNGRNHRYMSGYFKGKETEAMQMASQGMIPHRYLTVRCNTPSCFVNAKLGSNIAMKNVIENMIADGLLTKVPSDQNAIRGQAYYVSGPADFN